MKAEIKDGKLTVTARRNEGKEFSAAMHGLAEAGCIESVNTTFESWGSTINVVFWPSFGCEEKKKADELKVDKESIFPLNNINCKITCAEIIDGLKKERNEKSSHYDTTIDYHDGDSVIMPDGKVWTCGYYEDKIYGSTARKANLERDEILKKAREEAAKIDYNSRSDAFNESIKAATKSHEITNEARKIAEKIIAEAKQKSQKASEYYRVTREECEQRLAECQKECDAMIQSSNKKAKKIRRDAIFSTEKSDIVKMINEDLAEKMGIKVGCVGEELFTKKYFTTFEVSVSKDGEVNMRRKG